MSGWLDMFTEARMGGWKGREGGRKGEHVEKPRSGRLQGILGELKMVGLDLEFKPQCG